MVEGSRLRRLRCSSCTDSDTSRLALYLARIFMRGRSLSHHCSLGILCLRWQWVRPLPFPHPQPCPALPRPGTHSKSVSSLSCTTGWKMMSRLLIPSTQMESSVSNFCPAPG